MESVLTGACFVTCGLICFAAFLWRWSHERRAAAWTKASGVVVDSSRDSAPGITVHYRDDRGAVHEVGSVSGSSSFPDVGETTSVRFDPQDPAQAVIDVDVRTGRNLALLLAAIFTGIGGFLVLQGLTT